MPKGYSAYKQVGSRAACGKISGIPNYLNYCVIFIVYTQFANVTVGCIIQTGRPWVGDPWFKRSKYQKQQIYKKDSISVVFYSCLHERILKTR
jgi:hypothetical protein